jgi:hypothetical protein
VLEPRQAGEVRELVVVGVAVDVVDLVTGRDRSVRGLPDGTV